MAMGQAIGTSGPSGCHDKSLVIASFERRVKFQNQFRVTITRGVKDESIDAVVTSNNFRWVLRARTVNSDRGRDTGDDGQNLATPRVAFLLHMYAVLARKY